MTDWWSGYVGLPFVDGGRGPLGYDCWGLVRAVYSDRLGVGLPSYGEISAADLVRVSRQMEASRNDGWVECGPEPLAVALMTTTATGRRIAHVGVMVDERRVMHVMRATLTAVVPVTHFSVAGRIVGYRRLA